MTCLHSSTIKNIEINTICLNSWVNDSLLLFVWISISLGCQKLTLLFIIFEWIWRDFHLCLTLVLIEIIIITTIFLKDHQSYYVLTSSSLSYFWSSYFFSITMYKIEFLERVCSHFLFFRIIYFISFILTYLKSWLKTESQILSPKKKFALNKGTNLFKLILCWPNWYGDLNVVPTCQFCNDWQYMRRVLCQSKG